MRNMVASLEGQVTPEQSAQLEAVLANPPVATAGTNKVQLLLAQIQAIIGEEKYQAAIRFMKLQRQQQQQQMSAVTSAPQQQQQQQLQAQAQQQQAQQAQQQQQRRREEQQKRLHQFEKAMVALLAGSVNPSSSTGLQAVQSNIEKWRATPVARRPAECQSMAQFLAQCKHPLARELYHCPDPAVAPAALPGAIMAPPAFAAPPALVVPDAIDVTSFAPSSLDKPYSMSSPHPLTPAAQAGGGVVRLGGAGAVSFAQTAQQQHAMELERRRRAQAEVMQRQHDDEKRQQQHAQQTEEGRQLQQRRKDEQGRQAKQLAYMLHILKVTRGTSLCCGHAACTPTRTILERYRDSKRTGVELDAETKRQLENLKKLLAHYEKAKKQETFETDYICHTAQRWLHHIQMNRPALAAQPRQIEAWQTEHVLLPGRAAARVQQNAAAALLPGGVSGDACAAALAAARAHVRAILVRLVAVAKHRKACGRKSSAELPPSAYKLHFEDWSTAHTALREKRRVHLERAISDRLAKQQKTKRRKKTAAVMEEDIDIDGDGSVDAKVRDEVEHRLEQELPRQRVRDVETRFAQPQVFLQTSNRLPPAVQLADVLHMMEQFGNAVLPRGQFSTKQYEADFCGQSSDAAQRRETISRNRKDARQRQLSRLKDEASLS